MRSLDSFRQASQAITNRLRQLFPQTPLQENAYLSALYDARIYLKREDLSPVRSYKIRGAFAAMSRMMETDNSASGFVCASAGNHAQGFAYACKHFGVKGLIFMPVTTPQQKIQKTASFGGDAVEIILEGDYFDETLAAAKARAEKDGATFVPPFDHPDIILGQSTVASEIYSQLGHAPEMLIAPVGGGGLSAGLCTYFPEGVELHLVEPEGAPSLHAALNAGGPVTVEDVDNFVDGASVAALGGHNYAALAAFFHGQTHLVPENRLCATILDMLNIEGIVLEPAGALAVDVLKDMADQIKGREVVIVTSGGNFDFERLPDVKERALKYEGLKKYFILRLPQRPGALKDFLGILGPQDDIARFEYLKKSARNFGSVLIGIETQDKRNFERLFAEMETLGFGYQDITDDEILAQFLI